MSLTKPMKALGGMDWDDLRVFLDVARTGNLSQTARRLRIDHSTVSRRVSKLEMALGIALFERSKNGFHLTDLGSRLLPRAEAIENAVTGIREEAGNSDFGGEGSVRLATMEGIASLYLAPRISILRKMLPNLVLELVTSPQVIHVNRREADIFLSFFKPPGQGLISENIGRFQLYLYASPLYFEAREYPTSKADLQQHDFVSYIDDLIQVDAVRWLDDVVQGGRIVFRSNSMIAQMSAATAGIGLVLLPRFAVDERSTLLNVLPAVASTSRDIWLNVHQDLQFSPRIKAVVSFLKNQVAADAAAGQL